MSFILLITITSIQVYNNLTNYENTNNLKKEEKLAYIINNAKLVSNSLFDTLINKKRVIDIFKKANTSNEEEKVKVRKELYDLLIKDYEKFTNYGIQQFHFHLPNNESFLRFHHPSKFGDNLTDVRASVKYVNENQLRIVGFEEGRIFNGYRFVYPLFDENNTYIGSVELSSSLLNFKIIFEKKDSTDLDYILKKDIVEKKVFKEQLNNYKNYSLLDNFLIQRIIADYDINCKHKESKEYILKELAKDKKNAKRINNLEKFNTLYFHNFKVFSINFVPLINDFTSEKVGYKIMFTESDYFKYILDLYMIILIIILLSILIGYIIYKKEEEKELNKELAMHDQLTNIYNRHYFTKKIKNEVINNKSLKSELSLIMFDIDHFKLINDNYGHNIGDESLVFLSNLVKNNIRVNDIFCRWGGEEFIILSQKSLEKTIAMTEYLRNMIDTETNNNINIPHFTCSFGVISLENITTLEEGIKKVDELLYKSKNEGRNKVSY